jgi:hypothetical protein
LSYLCQLIFQRHLASRRGRQLAPQRRRRGNRVGGRSRHGVGRGRVAVDGGSGGGARGVQVDAQAGESKKERRRRSVAI